MKIIFYRDESGAIKSHHPAPKDMTQEEIDNAIEKYNDGSHGRTAEVVEVEEGSFEEYLLTCLERKYRVARDVVEEALDALETARGCVRALEVEK